MPSVPPVSVSAGEAGALAKLRRPVDKCRFRNPIRRLHKLFDIYARTAPTPLPAPGLAVTPEIRAQCEMYLPVSDITAVFSRLYSAALSYPPVFSSTPFHRAMSWADVFAALPPQFQGSANPARLLDSLLDDDELLNLFLFTSFLPRRFYGGMERYPGQRAFVSDWLASRRTPDILRILDAACGTGEDTYGLAQLLAAQGIRSERVQIEGWTVEPLEIWAATYLRLPHDRHRETLWRKNTETLVAQGFGARIQFRCVDLTLSPWPLSLTTSGESTTGLFGIILCNGLLGGPIINQRVILERTVGNLARLLAPGGLLLVADHFHGGWKQHCPQSELRAVCEKMGLKTSLAGEGIAGLKPD